MSNVTSTIAPISSSFQFLLTTSTFKVVPIISPTAVASITLNSTFILKTLKPTVSPTIASTMKIATVKYALANNQIVLPKNPAENILPENIKAATNIRPAPVPPLTSTKSSYANARDALLHLERKKRAIY